MEKSRASSRDSSTSSSDEEMSEKQAGDSSQLGKRQEPYYLSVKIPENVDVGKMNKRQIKKLQKTIYWESKLPEMRAKHRQSIKQKRLLKKQNIAQQIEQGKTVDYSELPGYAHGSSRNFKLKFKEQLKISQPIIIDCAFENLHYVKDMKSLGNQFSQLLGINRKLSDGTRGEM